MSSRPSSITIPQFLLGLAAVAIIATAVVYTVDRLGTSSTPSTTNATANTNVATTNTNTNTAVNMNATTNTNTSAAIKALYLGQGYNGKYQLINLTSGATKTFLPAGYTLLDQHEYDPLPSVLILQKGTQMYSYEVASEMLTPVLSAGQVLQDKEIANITPSISEKDVFFIQIVAIANNGAAGEIAPETVTSERSYLWNATTRELIGTTNTPQAVSCFKFDSANRRYFTWACGEGIGTSIPLEVRDMQWNIQNELISLQEYNQTNEGFDAVEYTDGYFIAVEKGGMKKLTVIDPSTPEPKKMTFVMKSGLQTDGPGYSAAYLPASSDFLIGGAEDLALLRTDGVSTINSVIQLKEGKIYPNFLFPYQGKVYYRAGDAIHALDVGTGTVRTVDSVKGDEVITIFLLP